MKADRVPVTGTLTEDGLDIWGVLGCENSKFHSSLVSSPLKLDVTSPLVAAMATCHTLTNIEGKLTGDPLDLTMFEATQWDLIEPGQDTNRYDMLTPTVVKPIRKEYQDKTKWVGGLDMETSEIPYEIGIVRQFPFSSSRQCMTVIARTLGSNHMTLYCKGAPEKISCLCRPNSIPEDFGSVLMNFTSAGYRVIALSYKPMDLKFNWLQAQKIKREQVETDLEFIGLLITQNMLKPESLPVIQELTAARIRCVMATGDNILTAVSVARNCGMVLPNEWVIQVKAQAPDETHSSRITYKILDTTVENSYAYSDCMSIMECEKWHFALDGKSWAAVCSHFPELLPYILTKGIVFSRMGPDQKTQLVEYLQNLDYIVAMCGDGANDCGALKAAHIGISLSEAEASVAAPFTSQIANIKCVLHLIREGRCALVTSFGVFKFMALYSLIQFISVLLLYMHGTMLGNVQFLYIDLVITTTLAVVMGRTGPTSKLVPQRPLGSLVAAVNVIPLLLQIVLTLVVQVAALYFLIQQDWFQPISPKDGEELIQCWENTSVFCVSCYQYLILATIYSKGYPYRNPFYTNSLFLLTLLSLTVFTTFLLVNPIDPLAEFFELMPLGEHKDMKHFRLWLLVLPLIHLISALIIEVYIANTKWLKDLVHFLTRKRVPKNKYKRVSEMTPTKLHWIAEIT
uniref:Cation-transporting P-type ATPase C-terminal domain-containing protein n=1 Tax=Timema cristinae TaxID=61476 RepID=A0A7R9CY25_TIMCR|nr:unnamed protein product [Timema cristinae]